MGAMTTTIPTWLVALLAVLAPAGAILGGTLGARSQRTTEEETWLRSSRLSAYSDLIQQVSEFTGEMHKEIDNPRHDIDWTMLGLGVDRCVARIRILGPSEIAVSAMILAIHVARISGAPEEGTEITVFDAWLGRLRELQSNFVDVASLYIISPRASRREKRRFIRRVRSGDFLGSRARDTPPT